MEKVLIVLSLDILESIQTEGAEERQPPTWKDSLSFSVKLLSKVKKCLIRVVVAAWNEVREDQKIICVIINIHAVSTYDDL